MRSRSLSRSAGCGEPTPEAHAPRQALEAPRKRVAEVRLWLHPATRLLEGKPVHRPLHAKLLLVGFRVGSTRGTLVLMGSPNMSRRALLLPVGSGQGNVELALTFRLQGSLSLRDVVPELAFAPPSAIELRERDFPEPGPNHALAIDEAVHDPVERTLVVTWAEEASQLPPWKLTYDGDEIPGSTVIRDQLEAALGAGEVLGGAEKFRKAFARSAQHGASRTTNLVSPLAPNRRS